MKRRILCLCKKTAALAAIAFLVCLNYSDDMRKIRMLPDTLYLTETTEPSDFLPQQAAAVTVAAQRGDRLSDVVDTEYTFRLFGILPLRTVTLVRTEDVALIPGGQAVGITLHTAGVLVVGLGTVEGTDGAKSPAAAAGLVAGDTILRVDGTPLKNAEHLSELCKSSDGSMLLTVQREDETVSLTLYPEKDVETGQYRIGAWVRDSTAGIGTLSFSSEELQMFAALGHPVSDIDTQSLFTVGTGELLQAEVMDVIRGEQGEPGELLGVFSVNDQSLGSIVHNTEFGVFGTIHEDASVMSQDSIPMAFSYEAHTGDAQLLATVDGSGVQAFDCEISRVNVQRAPAAKGMIVTVTDDRLLDMTGGIVQGMSGSPILQDGKLIGVVTHVFVNDPTKGYCIYAEWMVREMQACAAE